MHGFSHGHLTIRQLTNDFPIYILLTCILFEDISSPKYKITYGLFLQNFLCDTGCSRTFDVLSAIFLGDF
jgi:hypothetical protein